MRKNVSNEQVIHSTLERGSETTQRREVASTSEWASFSYFSSASDMVNKSPDPWAFRHYAAFICNSVRDTAHGS